jgi:hypothetical protein
MVIIVKMTKITMTFSEVNILCFLVFYKIPHHFNIITINTQVCKNITRVSQTNMCTKTSK